MSAYPAIPGAKVLFEWFGYWPKFHDAEVLSIELGEHAADCSLHVFRMTSAVDERGYYVLDRHATVGLHMTDIGKNNLAELTSPNVLLSLRISRTDDGYELLFFDVYGVEALIQCANLEITLKPASPKVT